MPRHTSDLSPKQHRFVLEYLKDFNGTRAAIAAGYSLRTAHAIASENLQKPSVRKVIEQTIESVDSQILRDLKTRTHADKRRAETLHAGYVYFIREPFGRVKIGKAANWRARLSSLCTASAYELEPVIILRDDNPSRLEAELHRAFADKRVRGEWFELSDEDIARVREAYGPAIDG